ncbi:DNA translocase FtsK [Burkholderia glumae]|uniref:DNA translocase FtsK n=2 Tax=Burkholderia glumae TaxID=337 RepID=UPI0001A4ADF4|nr:DNA translocase FtsK [Burkholderia glumae]ACR28672.1 DNA segregation ATPase FtsK/SpoIIIE-like protein [Burkholderia glumae BGR1]KHJ64697.1 cell division protein FtsK [Burkholderia glumae]PJO24870.1 cell division protein FtsK [Burkholderia glumae AU6208]QHE11833.1 cell division protein FtsK [Burkholderia glumae AU6208]RQZ76433.1 cell division protein FtsK [Burkholderia glumae]
MSENVLNMTAATIGKDLLSAVVTELKLLPDVWVKLSENKQNDVIDRLRACVEHNVKMATHLIASDGRVTVQGDLEQLTIKDGVKATVKFSSAAPNLHDLYDAQGKAVLLVVANPAEHTGGMDEVRGEADQRSMDLGREYTDDDGDGMDGPPDDVVDAEFREVPQLGDGPTQAQLDEQTEAGRDAAAAGKPESECPMMRGELCIAWVKGWKAWHEEQSASEPLYAEAVAFVIAGQRASISALQRHLRIGHNRAARIMEMLSQNGVVSQPDEKGNYKVLKPRDGEEAA